MTDDPIKSSIDAIAKLPEDQITLAVVAEQHGDAGAVIEGQKDIGKPGGWVVGGQAAIKSKSGWSLSALARWKKAK
jgi:hypothetical protein